LRQGQARQVEVDLLPTAYVFQPGHRMRLAMAGSAGVAPGLPFPQGPGPNPAAFTWTVMQDAGHPAVLALPVVGTAGEQLSWLAQHWAGPGTRPCRRRTP
jgi:predicted acyl esterase